MVLVRFATHIELFANHFANQDFMHDLLLRWKEEIGNSHCLKDMFVLAIMLVLTLSNWELRESRAQYASLLLILTLKDIWLATWSVLLKTVLRLVLGRDCSVWTWEAEPVVYWWQREVLALTLTLHIAWVQECTILVLALVSKFTFSLWIWSRLLVRWVTSLSEALTTLKILSATSLEILLA